MNAQQKEKINGFSKTVRPDLLRGTVSSSVIICTRNRTADLVHALNSLAQQTELPTELIIVDSSTTPVQGEESFASVFSPNYFPATQLKYLHTGPGLPYQRNIGIAHATCAVVHFLDDDVELDANYLQSMNSVFNNNPHFAGGMGTVCNIPDSYRYKAYCMLSRVFLLQRNFASGNFTLSGLPTHAYGNNKFASVEALGGCCMAYRRTVFQKHLFDEKLGGYAFMEDCDFSRRVSFDAPLFFNPDAKMLHFASPLARDGVVKNRAMYAYNYTYLFFKNVYPRNRLKIVFYCWSVIGLFVVAIAKRDWLGMRGYVQGLRNYYF